MKHVRQPRGSKLCGQACVAMLTGKTLFDGIEAVGHGHGTRTSELRKAVEALSNDKLGPTKRIGNGWLPKRALLKVTVEMPNICIKHASKCTIMRKHWIVLWDGFVFDPEQIEPYPIAEFFQNNRKWPTRITSYCEYLEA